MPDFGRCNLSCQFQRRAKFLVITFLILLSFMVNPWFWSLPQKFNTGFNFNSIFSLKPEDVYQINTRRSYYQNKFLGRIFENKLFFYWDKYKNNFFQGLDLNYYFFANHPRERTGVAEKEIFFWFWSPFFIIGFLSSLKKSLLIPNLTFLGVLSIVSFFAKIDNFVLLFVPFLTLNLYLGLKRLVFG